MAAFGGKAAPQEPACHALRKNNLARHQVVSQAIKLSDNTFA